MIADDLARAQDPNYGYLYYSVLWQELEHLTTISIHKAIIDLATLWRTAWVNAGGPSPLHIHLNNNLPNIYILEEAYPNPFNPSTTIGFDLFKTSKVTLKIYNILGEEMTTLVSEILYAGEYSYKFDASGLASGVYLYRLEAEGFVETKKLVLMR
jgi:hypothetical protein